MTLQTHQSSARSTGASCPRYAGSLHVRAAAPHRGRTDATTSPWSGVPFDTGVTYRPGARFGPAHIRQCLPAAAALQPCARGVAVRAASRSSTPATSRATRSTSPPRSARSRSRRSRLIRRRRSALALGGDHTIAYPLLQAHQPIARAGGAGALRRPPRHLGHLLRRSADPRHAVPPRRRGGPLRVRATARTSASADRCTRPTISSTDAELGFTVVHCREFQTARRRRRDRRSCETTIGDHPLYVSIDIDVLDPAHAPGTGTPEIGGMTSRELLEVRARIRRPQSRRRRHRRGRAGLRPCRDHRRRRGVPCLRVASAARPSAHD